MLPDSNSPYSDVYFFGLHILQLAHGYVHGILVGGLEHFSHIFGIIIPIDFHIF